MYLKYDLDDLPYLFYLKHFNASKSEFYTDDGIELNLPDIGPIASGCYAGKGRLRSGFDAQVMQDSVGYPMFLEAPHDFKEPDGIFRDHYIEIPLVLNGDMLTRYNYIIRHDNGEDVINHLFWTQADWEDYWDLAVGDFDPDVHGKDFSKKISVVSEKQNPGILYLMYPYYGPLPGEPDYTEEHFSGTAEILTKILTGGSSPQEFLLGDCFKHAKRGAALAGNYESILKLSVVRDVSGDGNVDQIDGYKSVIYNMLANPLASSVEGLFVRVTLTTPLQRPLTFTLDVAPAFSTRNDSDVIDNIPMLEEAFGLVNDIDNIISVTPTAPGVPITEFDPISRQVTIPAGQQSVLVPAVLKRPVDGRYSVVARVHSFDDRTDIKVLNNDLLMTNTLHSSDAYDDGMLAIRIKAEVYNSNNDRIASIYVDDLEVLNIPKDDSYTVDFTLEHFDRLKAGFKLSQGQTPGVTDKYVPDKHHKFYTEIKSDGNLTSIVTGTVDAASRKAPGWILAGGTSTSSVYTIPSTIIGSIVAFDFDFGYNYIIKGRDVTSNSTARLQIKLI